MKDRIVHLVILGIVGYALYFILAHHIIIFGREFEILKKEKLNLKHSFYNPGDKKEIAYKGLENILANEDLRLAGLGDVLVERELITQEELDRTLEQIDYGE